MMMDMIIQLWSGADSVHGFRGVLLDPSNEGFHVTGGWPGDKVSTCVVGWPGDRVSNCVVGNVDGALLNIVIHDEGGDHGCSLGFAGPSHFNPDGGHVRGSRDFGSVIFRR